MDGFHGAVPGTRVFIKYWLPVLVWMTVIFAASSDSMSSRRTSRIIGPVLRWLFPGTTDETVQGVQFCVRKAAHMIEYAILACLICRALRQPVNGVTRPWNGRAAVAALIVSIAYAASDEFHQRFVASREGSVRDVAVDSAGAALGLVLLWRLGRWRNKG